MEKVATLRYLGSAHLIVLPNTETANSYPTRMTAGKKEKASRSREEAKTKKTWDLEILLIVDMPLIKTNYSFIIIIIIGIFIIYYRQPKIFIGGHFFSYY